MSERFRGVSIFRPGQDYDSVLRAVRVLNTMLESKIFRIDFNIRDCKFLKIFLSSKIFGEKNNCDLQPFQRKLEFQIFFIQNGTTTRNTRTSS